jgi:hypothetical protein
MNQITNVVNHSVNMFEDELSTFENENSLETLKQLFYSCNFKKLIDVVDDTIKSADDLGVYFKCILLKSKALYELNRCSEAKDVLNKVIVAMDDIHHPDMHYMSASFHYFDGDFEIAKECFKKMMDLSTDKKVQFKALLGLGNIAYSQHKKSQAMEYLKELNKLKTDMSMDLLISLKLFEGTVYLYNGINPTVAKECFEAVYQKSFEMGWNFFSQRALYNLAKWCKRESSASEAKGILTILDMQLATTDSRFMSYLVNCEFDLIEHRSTFKFELCSETYEVRVGNKDKQIVVLERWPLLYRFLKLVSQSRGFVSKNKIAAYLWSSQDYKPKTHDPRIYDIVARLKKHLETFDERPLILESSIKGYKLNIR